MPFSQQSRAEARQIINGQRPPTPNLEKVCGYLASLGPEDVQPNTPEAHTIIGGFRAEQYAAIAKVVDELLNQVLGSRDDRPPYGLIVSNSSEKSSWISLRECFDRTFRTDIEKIRGSQAYMEADRFLGAKFVLDSRTYINTRAQLLAGTRTASSNMLAILQSIPEAILANDPNRPPDDWPGIAKQSSSLPTTFAMRSINQMLAAREAMAIEPNKRWQQFDPNKFVPSYKDGKLTSLRFPSLEELPLTPMHRIHPGIDSYGPFKTVGDVPDFQDAIIGCPITLLPGRMNELWDWTVDIVDASGLWQPTAELGRPS